MSENKPGYDVGGVLYPRPFKATRLGHMGIWQPDVPRMLAIYMDVLGLRQTDQVMGGDGTMLGCFTTCNTDHHALVAMNPSAADPVRRKFYEQGATLNQVSFQVNTLQEVNDAFRYFNANGIPVARIGRDLPGSNWAVYAFDPDGHRVELFYGMEQVGWNGRSKPAAMYKHLPYAEIPLPQPAEDAEVAEAQAAGIAMDSGFRAVSALPYDHVLGGIRSQRPFKIAKIGPVRLWASDMAASLKFYTEAIGLCVTEELVYRGHRCFYLRCGAEHHSIALLPLALRAELGFSERSFLVSMGLEVQTYRQLRDAIGFIRSQGLAQIEVPDELHPGIEHAVHFRLDDIHVLQVFFGMEQIGWNGLPRPASARATANTWPQVLQGDDASYLGQTRLGPLA